jgi:ATP-dependent Clp protease adaptor protein ClpS
MSRPPLSSLRILAVSQFGAGPFRATVLAGMGVVAMAIEKVAPETGLEDVTEGAVAPPWMTILHNCDCHTFEQVVRQLQKAIACSEAEGWEIAWQVHNTGKAVVKVGPETECVRVGNILASIGLIVTVVQS